MTTANKLRKTSTPGLRAGLLMIVVLPLCWSPWARAQSREIVEEPYAVEAEDELDFPLSPSETHTRIDAERELLEQAALYPESLVGRAVRLENGKPVGEVLNVRRRLDNLFIYLIVDATPYFNAPTTYAIPVREVERLDAGQIVMSLNPGMHVAGLTYYPEDYTSVKNNFPE